ncbi:TetR family transcriptional regulator [Planotetraspora phitsanulokensis]|uniref:TetR family transcriptional regulator n=1 Tax=Planotetraspora phitsanulokensis TaxID=575192 RepID=A0A8J3U6M4_9ACTN|nr:TetR family transcriptional regulator [Planotetraspora phitsanulokensis]GII39578.1 TetR family transcriptional regulator [Planotetraspora phitsanulokensis]
MRRSSEDTKASILAAARERFAADGYDRTTIRAVAADAAIDPAMVMRYFGNKEKLFAAAADFDLQLPDLEGVPGDRIGATLAAHFVERWEADEALMVLLRTAVTNEEVAGRMRAIFAGQLGPMAATLSGDPATAARRAGLVATQMLGVALCRYVLRLPPVVEMTREEIAAWLGPTLQRYLLGSPQ